MGQVWAGSHVVTGRAVAIKRLLLPLRAEEERHARARFALEARTACAVDHPNVVEVLDFVASGDGPPLLVMELLQGETLDSLLERSEALGVAETARLILPVVSAIGTAHARGIIHRDLKPANVFVSRRPGAGAVIKVLDFGIAKWIEPRDGQNQPCTRSGTTLGTPAYMAPEQAVGADGIDYKCDTWSLGVMLYECLTGVRPVDGKNAADMMMRLSNSGIVPIESRLPELPDDLAAVIGRMLAQDPAQRPSDLREVFAVLSAYTETSAPAFDPPGRSPMPSQEELQVALTATEDQSGVRGRELRTRTLDNPSYALTRRLRFTLLIGAIAMLSLALSWRV